MATILGLALSACHSTDPGCPQGATIQVKVPSGQCYDVEVREESNQDEFFRKVCADTEETITPGRYLYSVSKGGMILSSGSKSVACQKTLVINLATGQMTTTPGTPSPSSSPSPQPSSSTTPTPSEPTAAWSGPHNSPDITGPDFSIETGIDLLGHHHHLHALGTVQVVNHPAVDPAVPATSQTIQIFTELQVQTYQDNAEDFSQRVVARAPVGMEIQGPKMVVSEGGTVIVAWVQAPPPAPPGSFPNLVPAIYAAIYTPATGWSNPQLITSASGTVINFYHFGLDTDPSGNALIVWKEYEPSTTKMAARRFKMGAGWRAIERTALNASVSGMVADGIFVGLQSNGKASVIWNEGGAIFTATSARAGNWNQGETVLSNLAVGIPISLLDVQFDDQGNAAVAAFPSTNDIIGTPVFAVQANTFSPTNGWGGKVDVINLGDSEGAFDLAAIPEVSVSPMIAYGKLALLPSGDIVLAAGRSGGYRNSDRTYENTLLVNRFSAFGNTWGETETLDRFRRPVNLGAVPTSANSLAFDMDSDEDGFLAIAYPHFDRSTLKTVVRTLEPGQTTWSTRSIVSPAAFNQVFQPSITIQGLDDILVGGTFQSGMAFQSWTNLFF
jgi:hypothetical protein